MEKKYLISLLNAYLKSEKITLESVDFKKLYSLSRAHNLSAIVFCVLKNAYNKDIINKEIYKAFEDDFYEAVVRYDYQSNTINDIKTVLSKSDIRHVFFKGAIIRDLFPVPEARVMGDVDVLIDEESRKKAKDALLRSGFSLINSNGPVYDYKKDGVLVEVHTKILSGKVGSKNAEACFEKAIDFAEFNGSFGEFDINYHFAYLIAHIAHHFWFYGAGIKLILDLAVILKAYDIDLDKVLIILEGANLNDFAKVILSVTYKWFSLGKDYWADTEKTEEFLLSFGAFGNLNRSKAAVVERKELEEGKNTGAFKTRLRLLFPSYEKVKNIPYIAFIEGKPYLLPAAWVYRVYYNLKNRRGFVKAATTSLGDEKTTETAKRELEYFEEIGLV